MREGDTLVVTKLDRLARPGRDAREIIEDQRYKSGVKFALGPTAYDCGDPFPKMFLSMLARFPEFELDLIRMRAKEGISVAKAKGKLKGKPAKLISDQRTDLLELHKAGNQKRHRAGRNVQHLPADGVPRVAASRSDGLTASISLCPSPGGGWSPFMGTTIPESDRRRRCPLLPSSKS